ncbi:MAG TPA: PIN domain-containing protein [Solirubrobacterales bacterium]|nr:PIN domain-containing protein [Solirubrobacterales bacterium]
MKRCLDSWAVLAWLDGDEPAADVVERVIKRERPGMSWINLVEVHYRTIRNHGRQEADQVLATLRPLVTESLPGIAAMRSASSLKAEHPIALADCFAIALAAEERAALLTGDPEILDRTGQLPCKVVDLRADG